MDYFIAYLRKFIDFKFGLAGALVMGTIVFFVNLDHGWFLSLIAALKQGIYTFFFGGLIIKMLQVLLLKIKNKYTSIPLSVLSVSALTTVLVLFVHSLKGTPEPFLSTLPTIIMAPPGFLFLALKFKKNQK